MVGCIRNGGDKSLRCGVRRENPVTTTHPYRRCEDDTFFCFPPPLDV